MDGYKDLRLQIPDELLKYIKKLSIDQDMSLSKVIENMIRQHANQAQQSQASPQPIVSTQPIEPLSTEIQIPTPTAPGED